mgnify:CR=1 FL=1
MSPVMSYEQEAWLVTGFWWAINVLEKANVAVDWDRFIVAIRELLTGELSLVDTPAERLLAAKKGGASPEELIRLEEEYRRTDSEKRQGSAFVNRIIAQLVVDYYSKKWTMPDDLFNVPKERPE